MKWGKLASLHLSERYQNSIQLTFVVGLFLPADEDDDDDENEQCHDASGDHRDDDDDVGTADSLQQSDTCHRNTKFIQAFP